MAWSLLTEGARSKYARATLRRCRGARPGGCPRQERRQAFQAHDLAILLGQLHGGLVVPVLDDERQLKLPIVFQRLNARPVLAQGGSDQLGHMPIAIGLAQVAVRAVNVDLHISASM